MYLTSNTPARPYWYQDAKWLTGLALVFVLSFTLLVFGLSRISAPEPAQEILRTVLELTLLPEGVEENSRLTALRQDPILRPGEPFELIPGVNIFAEESELTTLSAQAARLRVSNQLADAILNRGLNAALTQVSDPLLAQQLTDLLQGPVLQSLEALLEISMMPSGLADGSRLANWQLQRINNPGEPVQPIVGVFLFFDPARLEALASSEIGLLVVKTLAANVLSQGFEATLELVSNSNLQARLAQTVQEDGRQLLRDYLSTLFLSQEPELTQRLDSLREQLAERPEEPLAIIGRMQTSAQELAELPPREANLVVLNELSQVMYEEGLEQTLDRIADPQLKARVASVSGPFELFTGNMHSRYIRRSWLFGSISAVLLLLLIFFSSGLGRLLSVGFAIMFASLLGGAAFFPLSRSLQNGLNANLPYSIQSEGIIGYLTSLIRYVLASVPTASLQIITNIYLVALLSGAALVVLALIIRAWGLLRPRRSRF